LALPQIGHLPANSLAFARSNSASLRPIRGANVRLLECRENQLVHTKSQARKVLIIEKS